MGAGTVVKPPPRKKEKRKHFPGYKLFNMEKFVCGIVAGSMSGKTTVLEWAIKNHICPVSKKDKYKIWIFAKMRHHDSKWDDIIQYFKKSDFDTHVFTNYEHLEEITRTIKDDEIEYPFTKHLFFCDDMGSLNRCKGITELCEAGRHCIMTFVSVHSPKNFDKEARESVHIWLLMRKLPLETIQTVYEASPPNMSFEEFHDLYKYTQKDGGYNFLYYDKIHHEFRKNFSEKIILD